MKKQLLSLVTLLIACSAGAQTASVADPTVQTAEIFIYCPANDQGLHAACLDEQQQWQDVGQLCASDYSAWGAEKKMISPCVVRAADGTWRAVWQLNDYAPTFATAYSADLITWRPQDYPEMSSSPCRRPVVSATRNGFEIVYAGNNGYRKTYATFDFRYFSPDVPADASPTVKRETITIGNKQFEGQLFTLTAAEVKKIRDYFQQQANLARQYGETMRNDSTALLPLLTVPVEATLTVDAHNEKAISDKLLGIFFEDISYAADGGLYAELVQNRDFEYIKGEGRAEDWGPAFGWNVSETDIATANPLSASNPHHAVVAAGKTIANKGWDGMALKQGAAYDFSCYVRNESGKRSQTWTIALVEDGKVLASVKRSVKVSGWTRLALTLTPNASATHAELQLTNEGKVAAAVDMVSLFPQDTYKGHGLRKDLAETIAALHPKFVRFPGGCMSHGQGIDNIYHWTNSVGAWQDRKPEKNIWNYHQTKGLGFYEFFQWCEDMGAEPLPVLAAGVPCQNSMANANGYGGQQGGIDMADMPAYCDEINNLIDWANGDPATNKWAKMRADAGHPAPFNLKYLGVGNEDIISTTFRDRYLMICKAVREKHPEIIICGTVGPFHAPSADYIEGWQIAKDNKALLDMVDEHYYESSGWFLNNQDYYDNYDRTAPKVYLGEYSAKAGGNKSNVETALAEAIHLCNIERNGDVVAMTSYAPLLCNTKHQNWNPDLIYFDNTTVSVTPSYETQRLFGTYAGDRYVASTVRVNSDEPTVQRRVVASVVRNTTSGKQYIKLVNALPVAVTLKVEGLSLPTTIAAEQLQGKPADRHAKATQSKLSSGSLILPPYSFSVLDITE